MTTPATERWADTVNDQPKKTDRWTDRLTLIDRHTVNDQPRQTDGQTETKIDRLRQKRTDSE